MSIETEVKVKVEDVDEFCRVLLALNPRVLTGRHFEDNHLLDFSDRRLASEHSLVRVRFANGRHILTYKGAPRAGGIFKVREELETTIGDGPVLLQTFERIGLRVAFRYQKYRREFLLADVHLAVDETPIGNYVELEGEEPQILNLAKTLGISQSQFLRSSYYSLYREYCIDKGVTPGFMVFQHET